MTIARVITLNDDHFPELLISPSEMLDQLGDNITSASLKILQDGDCTLKFMSGEKHLEYRVTSKRGKYGPNHWRVKSPTKSILIRETNTTSNLAKAWNSAINARDGLNSSLVASVLSGVFTLVEADRPFFKKDYAMVSLGILATIAFGFLAHTFQKWRPEARLSLYEKLFSVIAFANSQDKQRADLPSDFTLSVKKKWISSQTAVINSLPLLEIGDLLIPNL